MTRPTAPTTLTEEQIGDLRRDVEAGKRRRVVLLTDSAGLPAGGMGDVIRVGQPDTDGSDFIGVRIGGDELFFAPAELGLGGRRSAAKTPTATAPAPAKAGPAKTGPAKTGTADDAAAASAYAAATKAAAAKTAAAKTAKARTAPAASSATAAGTTAGTTSPPKANPAKAPAKTARGRKAPKLPAIAITIRSTDAGWTVEALRGGKTTLKATPVRAGTVQEIADALDESVVTAIVREVLDARRAVAESEALELREALARAEAVLAEYDAGH